MAHSVLPAQVPVPAADSHPAKTFWRRLLGRANGAATGPADAGIKTPPAEHGQDGQGEDDARAGLIRRVSRKVVPGLPRAQTWKRQQSERRNKLAPVQPTSAERRAVSMDRRLRASQTSSQCPSNPRTSAPDFLVTSYSGPADVPSVPASPISEKMFSSSSIGDLAALLPAGPGPVPVSVPVEPVDPLPVDPPPVDRPPVEDAHFPDTPSQADAASMTSSQYDQMIRDELERIWILNLSMHFRDKSKREKFFVTYRERETLWRRVTISLDYRYAPEHSLEMDLIHTKFQREKNAKIYDAIRESLVDIQFYDTVTNLKLQTTDGRLHVHVVEDVTEIIHYPSVRMVQHLGCRRVKECDIEFDSHMSGFVYKVRVNQHVLIKKEIPGPDTVDEFLYEVNALSRLRSSHNVIRFYGVIVDNNDEYVKGLLISYAEQGALIDMIYDSERRLSWPTREKWARQIVEGLSEIHEAGFVQGDFTLSNIVIDNDDNAKIIDINRRGCPVGWEPPEATPLIDSSQRISMYIGVKSDLYQLGMVLWALAMQEDEPEGHGRPLLLSADVDVPPWYRTIVETCLADDPRVRAQALQLLALFPGPGVGPDGWVHRHLPPSSGVDSYQNGGPQIRTVEQPNDWPVASMTHTYVDPPTRLSNEPYFFPTRGRSPPSPLPSNYGCDSPHRAPPTWTGYYDNGRGVASTTEGTQSDTITTSTSTDSLSLAAEKSHHVAVGIPDPALRESRDGKDSSEGDVTPHAEIRELVGGARGESGPRAGGLNTPAVVVGEEHTDISLDNPARHSGTLGAEATATAMGNTAPEHANDRINEDLPNNAPMGGGSGLDEGAQNMRGYSSATNSGGRNDGSKEDTPSHRASPKLHPDALNGIGAHIEHPYLDDTATKEGSSFEDDFALTTATTTAMTITTTGGHE